MSLRRKVVAVIGGAHAPEAELAVAEELGRALVDAGFRIVTGGLGGVMAAASRGARSSSAWCDGDVIGVLPGLVAEEANAWVDVVIATGMNHARNVVVVATGDVVVAVGGGAGTLSELALAWQHQKHVVALQVGVGWSARLAGECLDDRRDDRVHGAATAAEAVEVVQRLLDEERPRHHGV
jgi:uncharacterized protein (TIGR00725 family)